MRSRSGLGEGCPKLGQLTWPFCCIGDPEGPPIRSHAYRGPRSTGGGVVHLLAEPDSTVGQHLGDGVQVVPSGQQQRTRCKQLGGEQVLQRYPVSSPSTRSAWF